MSSFLVPLAERADRSCEIHSHRVRSIPNLLLRELRRQARQLEIRRNLYRQNKKANGHIYMMMATGFLKIAGNFLLMNPRQLAGINGFATA